MPAMRDALRYLGYLALAGVAWWFWSSHIRDPRSVSEEEALETNARNMARCIRNREFASGLKADSTPDPERECARKLGLYRFEGQWHTERPPPD
jgi:hypothetical protein